MSINRNSEDMGAGCVVHLISMAVCIPLFGFVLMTLWRWFMVPTYGLPPIGFGEALGTGLVVSLLTKEPKDPPEDKTQLEIAAGTMVLGVLRYFLALAFGFIYLKLFM